MRLTPPLVADDVAVEIDDTDLILHRPVDELPEPERSALHAWLTEHDIDPTRVAVGAPVERHEESSSLSWREDRPGGRVVHHAFPAVAATDRWPAPFPELT